MSEKSHQQDWVTYKRLLSYVAQYWYYFAFSIFGFFLYSISQIAMADLMQFIVDSISGDVSDMRSDSGLVTSFISYALDGDITEKRARNVIPVVILIIGLIRGVGFFFGNYYMTYVARYLVHNLRCHIFDHLLVVPSREYDGHSSGFLVSKIIFNVEQVTSAATDALKILIREGIFAIGLIIYLFYRNWQLTSFFLVSLPLIGLIVWWVGKRFRRISRKIQDSMGDVTQVASETINAYREVRIFGGTKYERQRFYDASKTNRLQAMKMAFYNAITTPVVQLPVLIVLAILVWVGLGISGTMSAGQFVSYLTAALLLPKPVRQLSEVYSKIQKGLAASEDIFAFIDSDAERDHGNYRSDKVQGTVEFKGVSFAYSDEGEQVLKNINLKIEPGQTVALVGLSGSGKSTLVNILSRFYDHDSGDILLDGVDVNEYALDNLRSHIALVTQSVTLFNDSIRNNIAYGAMHGASDDDVIAAATSAHAMEFIEKMPEGLSTVTGEDGVTLSGGQRQRIAIARALLKDSPILIMDEATSALDNKAEYFIQEALEVAMEGRTTIVIAHRLSTIENADSIIVMDDGAIIEQGNHQQLLAKGGRYAELYQKKFTE